MIPHFFVRIWIWWVFVNNRNKLPTKSTIDNPKMEIEGLTQAFIWEDEGLWEFNKTRHLPQAFKPVIVHRTSLVLGPENDSGFLYSKRFDRQIFNMAKRYFPDWIGFHKSRCSYSPEVADRMIRIKKVAEWRLDKFMDQE